MPYQKKLLAALVSQRLIEQSQLVTLKGIC